MNKGKLEDQEREEKVSSGDILDELLSNGFPEGADEEVGGEEGDGKEEAEGEEGEQDTETSSGSEGGEEVGGETESEEESEEEASEGEDDDLADLKPGVKKEGDGKEESKEEQQQEAPSQEDLDAKRAEFRKELEASFAISDDDATLMMTEPEMVFPRLAANLYERVVTDLGASLQQLIPQMVQQQQMATAQEDQAKQEFLGINPDLGSVENLDQHVAAVAPQIQQLYPQANHKQVMRLVGQSIRSMLNMPAPAKESPASPNPAPRHEPPKPAAPGASGFGGASTNEPPEGENPFITELIETANL